MLDEQDDSTTEQAGDARHGDTPPTAEAPPTGESGSSGGRPVRRRRAAGRPAGPPTAVAFAAPQQAAPTKEVEPPAAPSTAAAGVPLFQPPQIPDKDQPGQKARSEGDQASRDEQGADRSAPAKSGAGATQPKKGNKSTKARSGASGKSSGSEKDTSGGRQSDEGTAEQQGRDAAAETAESGQETAASADGGSGGADEGGGPKRRRRRRRRGDDGDSGSTDSRKDEVTAVKGSTRMEAKKQRRREGRESGRRRAPVVSEAEFLARRESVKRTMIVRERGTLTQIGVLEDGILVEHYVNQATASSQTGNVYLGRVQNVLPSMEAAFVDIGRGRNAVLYAGEVNWDAAGLEGQPKRIEHALSSGDKVLVQVTKDPIGHKGARLTSQVSLPGRFLVYVPDGSMTGISRRLPDKERSRLRAILREIIPEGAGVIVRTAAEGASEEDLTRDVEHLKAAWERIKTKAEKASPPKLLHSEPDLALRIVRDIFNADFESLTVSGDSVADQLVSYIAENAPGLSDRVVRWTGNDDVFAQQRLDEQLAKALDRKVYLPSGGSLVIDRTEAMTVIDVNTGRFTGQGGNLEETVTRNNLEAAEEVVRQIRLRDSGGIIVIDFIDMVLESNRDLVLRRLVECLGRDRTKHQVAEVTSLGLVQMTRKKIGQGLLETFSENCECCAGRGVKVHTDPVERRDRERRPRSVRPPGAHDPVEAARSAAGSAEANHDDEQGPPEPESPQATSAAVVEAVPEPPEPGDTSTISEDVDALDLDGEQEPGAV